MTHCAKCGAELIGTRKFCTACGAPAGDPRSPAASTGMGPAAPPAPAPGRVQSSPSIQYAPSPASAVNPFAQTAGPKSMPVISAPGDYGPPPPSVPPELATTTPGVGDPSKAPQVSPLAVSNVDAKGGAMVDAMVASARAARAASLNPTPEPPQPDSTPTGGPKRGVLPGTQIMPSMANSPAPSAPAASAQPLPSAKRPDKTQLLGAIPMPRTPSAPRAPIAPSAPPVPSAPASVKPPAVTPPAAQSGSYPSGTPDPSRAEASGPHAAPRGPSQPDPSSSQPGVPLPQGLYPPQPQPQPQGWNPAAYVAPAPAPYMAPPPAPAYPPAYGYGYPPGTRVNVTWSNGQRYPGTVQQNAGTQCLVVFPDGQHHWVDLQYVGPA